MASPEKRAAQLSTMPPTASPPASKQTKLVFKRLSQEEFECKQKVESIDHRASKEKAVAMSTNEDQFGQAIAERWGLQWPRPLPKSSKDGPKGQCFPPLLALELFLAQALEL